MLEAHAWNIEQAVHTYLEDAADPHPMNQPDIIRPPIADKTEQLCKAYNTDTCIGE